MTVCPTYTRFLEIRFGDRSFNHDVVVYPDGRIERRDKRESKKYADAYGHTPLSREELEKYLRESGDVDCILIGTGQEGAMPLTHEAEELIRELSKRGVKTYVLTTPELVAKCNELLEQCRRALMVIHVTC